MDSSVNNPTNNNSNIPPATATAIAAVTAVTATVPTPDGADAAEDALMKEAVAATTRNDPLLTALSPADNQVHDEEEDDDEEDDDGDDDGDDDDDGDEDDDEDDDDMDGKQGNKGDEEGSSSNNQKQSSLSLSNNNSSKKRRMIVGEKADLYSHFETLNEKAYTKGGRDLGLYLCICRYCAANHRTAHAAWQQQAGGNGPEPVAPTPFPRTKRYCINHQKQCPHLPDGSVATLLLRQQQQQQQQQLSPPRKQRARTSGTFLTTTTTTPGAIVTTHIPNPHAATLAVGSGILPSTFEVFVAKDTFKFNAAHFVAFRGYRERLHGHNYTVSVRIQGARTYIGPDGYVIDYGNIKKVCKDVCKDLNEHFLCPIHADVLKISHLPGNQMVRIDCVEDGTYFEFPIGDVKFLPLVHATTEELAVYLWSRIMEQLDAPYLLQRGITSMELTVAEAPGQQATFRHAVQAATLDVRAFIQKGPVVPQPCLDKAVAKKMAPATAAAATTTANNTCGPNCQGCGGDNNKFSPAALQSLTNAMKAQGLLTRDVAPADLQNLMLQHQQNAEKDDLSV